MDRQAKNRMAQEVDSQQVQIVSKALNITRHLLTWSS